MTDRKKEHNQEHDAQLKDEQLGQTAGGGVTQGAFRNVEGLDSETEVVEYQDGNDKILRKRSR